MDINNHKKCKKCKFANDINSSYCQNCGFPLKEKLRDSLKNINFGNVAGAGSKGVSVAPLFAINSKSKIKKIKIVTNKHSLADGSWFCPYCGEKNYKESSECRNCFRDRP